MNKRAYILLGSNISARKNIKSAVKQLQDHFNVTRISKVYETAPVLKTNVENYLNACVEIITDLSPIEIKMHHLRRIESDMGRIRTSDKFKPRIIDLDLILVEDLIYEDASNDITLPDPEILQYAHIVIFQDLAV